MWSTGPCKLRGLRGRLVVKSGDGEVGDTGGNFFLVHLFWISRSD